MSVVPVLDTTSTLLRDFCLHFIGEITVRVSQLEFREVKTWPRYSSPKVDSDRSVGANWIRHGWFGSM